jgi:hypothetical protein
MYQNYAKLDSVEIFIGVDMSNMEQDVRWWWVKMLMDFNNIH